MGHERRLMTQVSGRQVRVLGSGKESIQERARVKGKQRYTFQRQNSGVSEGEQLWEKYTPQTERQPAQKARGPGCRRG